MTSGGTAPDLRTELLELARATAEEAAALVGAGRSTAAAQVDTKSSPVDVVTAVDTASEALIVRRLLEARPDDGVLGEEGASTEGTSGVRWVVDPIDGTVNFLYGLPQYAVSIAAEQDGVIVAGVVINAATGVEYAATLGDGATRDGRSLAVRATPPLGERLVLTGFHYDAELRGLQAAAVARLLPRVRDIRRLGSCALDLCHLAEGSADAYLEEGASLWDHAAGALIAREAGATTRILRGVGGRELLVAAPGAGFEEFLAAAMEAGFLA